MAGLLILPVAGLAPAQATIIQSGRTSQEDVALEEEAHAAGARHDCVVGIVMRVPASAGGTVHTGVYLGTSSDGRRGLVLTVARPFRTVPPLDPGASISVFVGPHMARGAAGLRIPVAKIQFHPESRLAILEFDPEGLSQAGITPAVLYEDESAATAPLTEGEIVGFGRVGHNASPTLGEAGKTHGGNTRVTYGPCLGHRGFHHWSPLSEQRHGNACLLGVNGNIYPFLVIASETTGFLPGGWRPIPIRSHPNQALFAPGDDGGPLLFNTDSGPKVAGIASLTRFQRLEMASSTLHFLDVPFPDSRLFVVQSWESVADHLGWIREVRGAAQEIEMLELESPKEGGEGRFHGQRP